VAMSLVMGSWHIVRSDLPKVDATPLHEWGMMSHVYDTRASIA
jgi:hypothetical protein